MTLIDARPHSLDPDAPEKVSKLAIIKREISSKRLVVSVGEVSQIDGYGGWKHVVDLYVAPALPKYEAEPLNEFMGSLVHDVFPSGIEPAKPHTYGGLELGNLTFTESIGVEEETRITRTTTAYEEELRSAGIRIEKICQTRQRELRRRTNLRVFPDELTATTIFEYQDGIRKHTVIPTTTLNAAGFILTNDQLAALQQNPPVNPFGPITYKR